MVLKLREATQIWLGDEQAVVAAVLGSPDRIQLADEDIGDIFDYLKLQNLMDWPRSHYQLYATLAAYVGYGKGLCDTYTDEYACEREEGKLSHQRVQHVDLNPDTLSGTFKSLQSARDGMVEACFVDSDLRLGRKDGIGDADNGEQYWTAVSNRIRKLAKSFANRVYMPHVTELLLTGTSAANERFRAAIRAALYSPVADKKVLALFDESRNGDVNGSEQWQSLFSYATARGAVEFAKRMQEGPVYCAQSDEYKQRWEDVHGEGQSSLLKQRPDGRLT